MFPWPIAQVPSDLLDQILDSKPLVGAHVGVCVTDDQGTPVYERNATLRFVPASNQKVVTCLFALEALGPSFRGSTQVWKANKRVIVRSSGDLTLTLENLRRARRELKLNQNWPVTVLTSFQPQLGPGWEWDDLPWYYAAPTSSAAFDHAQFEVWARGGRLEPLPPELGIKVVKGSKTVFDPGTNTLTTGRLPSARTSLGRFAQPKPLHALARALGGALSTQPQPVPDRPADYVHQTEPLPVLLKECLEESDNVMAEQLLVLAATEAGDLTSFDYSKAVATERSWLSNRAGMDADWFRPADGSGLSRHNQVSPRAVCHLLAYALKQPYAEPWQTALAAGGEGTLRSRLKNSTFVGKTGTMDAVVCLSGYVKTKDGRRLIVSFLVNNTVVPASEVRSVQDRFVRALENGNADEPRN